MTVLYCFYLCVYIYIYRFGGLLHSMSNSIWVDVPWRTVPPAAVTFWNAAFCSAASFPAGAFASWRMEGAWKVMWTTKKYKSWWLYILGVLLPNYKAEVNDNPLGIPISQWFFSPSRHEKTAFFQLRMMISTAYMSRRFACCFVEDLLDLLPPEG